MSAPAALENLEKTNVGMGQVVVARKPAHLAAILGSCIGVAIHHSRNGVGVLGHVVLPRAEGRVGAPGKFADTAIPYMLEMLRRAGVGPGGLVARIAGGANMFGSAGPLQVGEANAEEVIRALALARIPLAGKHVGGQKGRRTVFDCGTGNLTIEIIGAAPVVL
jgi:chemotaxis protein CheD